MNTQYTVFGEYFRILRIKHHEVLADAKEFLGVSAAFISSVETGKKNVPNEWEALIAEHYELNCNERKELKDAIENSRKTIKIDLSTVSDLQRQVAIQFQRSFEEMDVDSMIKIKSILEKGGKNGL